MFLVYSLVNEKNGVKLRNFWKTKQSYSIGQKIYDRLGQDALRVF